MSDKQEVGKLGEDAACKFLVKHGFVVKDRNYGRKWGEIDIVAEKGNLLHFIEVKTVSHVTSEGANDYLPEDNVHLWKRKRLARIIKTYILDKNVSDETEWQVDVLAVFLDFKTRKANIRVTENIIL